MTWLTFKTTGARWEAELIQQMLAAHGIPVRVVNQGVAAHFGCGTPVAIQVRPQDRWTALLLSSPIEEEVMGRMEEE